MPPPSQNKAFEYQVKAAFIYKFIKFVEWTGDTASADRPALVIGVLGDDPFGPTLDDAMRGKTVNGRALAVKRFPTTRDLEPCQILFVGTSPKPLLPEILDHVGKSPILTIGEGDRFAQDGGMIGLLTEDNKVRFEINLVAAERAGLKISSKLLTLARIVHPRGGKGH